MGTKRISDEALLAFVEWCRLNDRRIVGDPLIVRRVLNAYTRWRVAS